SPLSPLNAVSRLFLQNQAAAASLLGKRFNELQKLQANEQLLNATRFLPLHTLNHVLKPSPAEGASSQPPGGLGAGLAPKSADMVEEMTNGMREFYADLPEQEGP